MNQTQATNVDEYIAEQKAKLEKSPGCATTRYNLGLGYLSKRMFVEAEQAFKEAVEESPKMAEAYVQLGGICLQRGDLDGCLRYNLLAAQAQPFFAVPHANIGFVYMQRGEADQAVKAFERAIKRDPKFVQAHANMGGIKFMQGKLDESIEHSQKALEIEPMFGPAYHNLAMVYLEKGDYEKAAESVAKAEETGYEIPENLRKELADQLKK